MPLVSLGKIKASISTTWVGDGKTTKTAFRPKFCDDFPSMSWTDITGSDPVNGPATFNIKVTGVQADIDLIKANPSYINNISAVAS